MLLSRIEFLEKLKKAKSIAVVGLSTNPWSTSNYIAKHMQELGYKIVPVNPNYKEVLGEPCFESLSAIPENVEIDIVNVFRNHEYVHEVMLDAIQAFGNKETKPLFWTQLGVHNPSALNLAEQHGFAYVADKCIDAEYVRAFGETPLLALQ